MTTEIKRILHINDQVSAINPGQLSVESSNDADLGYRMWGGKDWIGGETKWLAKDKAARTYNLTVQNLSEGLVVTDDNGVLSNITTLEELNELLNTDITEGDSDSGGTRIQASIAIGADGATLDTLSHTPEGTYTDYICTVEYMFFITEVADPGEIFSGTIRLAKMPVAADGITVVWHGDFPLGAISFDVSLVAMNPVLLVSNNTGVAWTFVALRRAVYLDYTSGLDGPVPIIGDFDYTYPLEYNVSVDFFATVSQGIADQVTAYFEPFEASPSYVPVVATFISGTAWNYFIDFTNVENAGSGTLTITVPGGLYDNNVEVFKTQYVFND